MNLQYYTELKSDLQYYTEKKKISYLLVCVCVCILSLSHYIIFSFLIARDWIRILLKYTSFITSSYITDQYDLIDKHFNGFISFRFFTQNRLQIFEHHQYHRHNLNECLLDVMWECSEKFLPRCTSQKPVQYSNVWVRPSTFHILVKSIGGGGYLVTYHH